MNTDMATVLRSVPEHDSSTDRPDIYKTRSGIVLRLRKVAPFILRDVAKNFPEPKIPRVPNIDKGPGVLEENPNDPGYVRELNERAQAIGDVTNAILLVRGTTIEYVPDTVEKLDDSNWSDDVKEFAGLDVPDSGRRRYLCWLKYVALDEGQDYMKLVQKIMSLGGETMEVAVAQATEEFRPNTARNADNGISDTTSNGRGHSDNVEVSGNGT